MKMRFLCLAGLMLAAMAGQVQGAFVSGSHQTALGKEVNLSGLEWRMFTDTANLSRYAVEDQLVTGGTYEGWRYASQAEVNALMDSVWGGTTHDYSDGNVDGVLWLAENFGADVYSDSTRTIKQYSFDFGTNAEVGPDNTFYGLYAYDYEDSIFGEVEQGQLYPGTGVTPGQIVKSSYASGTGHALVRASSTAVPEPCSIISWVLGAAGMIFERRRRSITGAKHWGSKTLGPSIAIVQTIGLNNK